MKIYRVKRVVLWVLLPGIFFSCGLAFSSTKDNSLWLTALKKYQKKHYAEAAVDLTGIIHSQYSPYESTSYYLLSKCYLKQKKTEEAEGTAQQLIRSHPQSRYVPYAYYVLAQSAFLKKDYPQCARQLLTVAQTANDVDLRMSSRHKMLGIFESFLSDNQREELLQWVQSPEILSHLKTAQQGYSLPANVGVILDLSGPNAIAGEGILSGIRAAESKSGLENVRWIVRDSGGRVIDAVKAVHYLIHKESVSALVGDVEASCSAAIAGIACEQDIPLIIPSIQNNNLTEVGDCVFQLFTNCQLEGSIIAAFTREELGAERAAILAPVCEEGRQRVRGFSSTFTNEGGVIDSIQWYYQGAQSYKRQLDALIEIGAYQLGEQYGLSNEQITEFIQWDKKPEEEKRRNTYFLDVAEEIPTIVDTLIETYGSPINYFDILYIPIQWSELSLLSPQIEASGFSGNLIGSADCLKNISLGEDWRYFNGIIFPSHFRSSGDQLSNSDLTESISSSTDQPFNQFMLSGWDACRFLTSALPSPAKRYPKEICRNLQAKRRFEGSRLTIVFPEGDRINKAMYILQFKDGKFLSLKSPQEVANNYLR